MALSCWKCGASLQEVPRPLARLSRCPECFSDLRCCRMCRKFAPQYTAKCSDDRADPPENKQGANFCDWYVPDPKAYSGHEKSAEDQAKENLAALFGGVGAAAGNTPTGTQTDAAADHSSASDKALEAAKQFFKPEK